MTNWEGIPHSSKHISLISQAEETVGLLNVVLQLVNAQNAWTGNCSMNPTTDLKVQLSEMLIPAPPHSQIAPCQSSIRARRKKKTRTWLLVQLGTGLAKHLSQQVSSVLQKIMHDVIITFFVLLSFRIQSTKNMSIKENCQMIR